MKYFVTSDIHGFFDEFIFALNQSNFDVENPNHKLIILGDLFDRGRKAKELQTFVMDLIAKDKVILIRGNHEDLVLDLIDNYQKYMGDIKSSHHYENGAFQTMLDLTGMHFNHATTCLLEFKRQARQTDDIKHIIPKMKNYFETEHYVFTHSWIPLKKNDLEFNGNWRRASKDLWAKARWKDPVDLFKRKLFLKDKTLVFGHYHCSAFWADKYPEKYSCFGENACFKPFITREIIAIDARTVVSKKVNLIEIED